MLFSTFYDEKLGPITLMISDPDEGLSPPLSTKKVTLVLITNFKFLYIVGKSGDIMIS